MFFRTTFTTALVAVATVAAAQAGELKPMQGSSIALGQMLGTAYYWNEADGAHILATLADPAGGAPVRVLATLLAGQRISISVPPAVGEPATEMVLSRRGERVFVTDGAALTNAVE
jgi:hypothetical protein